MSYSWDSDDHVRWVRELAERLVNNGVTVLLDQWHVQPGENVIQFMEQSVAECDRVIIVCTPNLERRSAKRLGGIGYEQQIVSARIVAGNPQRKFIPVLRKGTIEAGEECAIPAHLAGILAVDFRSDAESDVSIERLLRAIFDEPLHRPPPLGKRPNFDSQQRTYEDEWEDEKVGVLPRLEIDGWELSSGEQRNAEHPETFYIPSAEERNNVPVGHFVKVVFEVREPNDESDAGFDVVGERMWVKVVGFDGPYIVGTWANTSLCSYVFPQLSYGRPVALLPEHVIEISSLEEMMGLPISRASSDHLLQTPRLRSLAITKRRRTRSVNHRLRKPA